MRKGKVQAAGELTLTKMRVCPGITLDRYENIIEITYIKCIFHIYSSDLANE